jgi:hypothetical protein
MQAQAEQAMTTSTTREVTLQQLRAMPELTDRADAMLSSGPEMSSDLLNLHYLTGGKLLK